jgi:hypothetical protein
MIASWGDPDKCILECPDGKRKASNGKTCECDPYFEWKRFVSDEFWEEKQWTIRGIIIWGIWPPFMAGLEFGYDIMGQILEGDLGFATLMQILGEIEKLPDYMKPKLDTKRLDDLYNDLKNPHPDC